jgi:hypothetical protein
MDDFVRSRNTRTSSWRRGGQRTKFSDLGKEAGPPTNSQASKLLPPSVDGTGAPLASIYVNKITLETLLGDEKPVIRDCQYVASYNWLDKKTATILVPGTTIYTSAPQTLTIKTDSRLATSLPPTKARTHAEARQRHVLQRPQCGTIPSIPSRAGDPRTFNFRA